jgi:hypothetical protein
MVNSSCRIYIIQSLSIMFFSPIFLSLLFSHCSFAPTLGILLPRYHHSMHIHMRTAMNTSQSRSSFSVDISSIYHPPPCLLSFHKILKLTSKIHPTQNVAQKITSIHQLSISSIVHFYCVTGVADGDVRVWVSFLFFLFFIGLWLRGGSTKFCFWPPYAFSWPVGRA